MSDTDTTPSGRGKFRLRPQITATVHPDTVERMFELSTKYKASRGQLIDKMTLIMWKQWKDGRVYCATGEACRFNRTDVPEIL